MERAEGSEAHEWTVSGAEAHVRFVERAALCVMPLAAAGVWLNALRTQGHMGLPAFTLQALSMAGIYVVVLLRGRLAPLTRLRAYAWLSLLLGLIGLAQWGLPGQGLLVILMALIVGAVAGWRHWLLLAGTALAGALLVAAAYTAGLAPIDYDPGVLLRSPGVWALALLHLTVGGFATLVFYGARRTVLDSLEFGSRSEARLRGIFGANPMGMHIYALRADGALVFEEANEAAAQILGFDHSGFEGRPIEEILPPVTQTDAPEHLQRIAREGGAWNTDYIERDQGAIVRAYEIHVFQIEPGRIVGLFDDVSPRKIMEDALRASETQYRELVQSANSVILRMNCQGVISFMNAYGLQLFGYAEEELIGQNVIGTIVPETETTGRDLRAMIQDIGRNPNRYALNENENMRRSGERLWIAWTNKALKNAHGEVVEILCIGNDVTPRRRAEAALQESTERYGVMFECAADAVFVMRGRRFTECNPAATKLFRFTGECFLPKAPHELSPPHQPDGQLSEEKADAIMDAALAGEPQAFEWRHVRADATPFDAEVRLNRLELPGGPGLLAVVRDVSQRKCAEQALRERDEMIRALVESSRDWIWAINAQGVHTYSNPAVEEILGHPAEEIVGHHAARFIHEDDRPKIAEHIEAATANRTGWRGVLLRWRHKDGAIRCLESTAVPIIGADGELAGFRGVDRDVTDRIQAEEERTRLLMAIEQAAEIIVITDESGAIQYVNAAFERITGYAREEALGQNPRILKSGHHDAAFYAAMWRALRRGDVWSGRFVNKKKDGELYTEEATISPVRDTAGRIVNYVAAKRDVTAEIDMEAQLLQAQKMEAVGRLAGGVAHDYNNMISVMLGYAQMALDLMEEDHPFREHMREIEKAAQRSGALTRQLLAFARRQTASPRVLDLNATLENMFKMLKRLIGEDIELVWAPQEGLWPIHMDPTQLDQVLANLCVNARDAIRGVGRVTIETKNTMLDPIYAADHPEAPGPGDYVQLAVSDTGCGMDKETAARIFEPFFTTKEMGKGTGLGLATVYGIVKQNNGFIEVHSEPSLGTTFRICLPKHAGDAENHAAALPATGPRNGRRETLLYVEDQLEVLRMGRNMLERLGYTVLAAPTPAEAIALADAHPGAIDLLVTDVVMPGMNGKQLAEELHTRYPGLAVLYVSGYSTEVIAHHGMLDHDVDFLEKPFTMTDLAGRIEEILARGSQ